MPTFPKGHANKRTHADNADLIRKLEPETETPTRPGVVTFTYSAADWITLRGIPAIGRGVAGAIPGSNPAMLSDPPNYNSAVSTPLGA